MPLSHPVCTSPPKRLITIAMLLLATCLTGQAWADTNITRNIEFARIGDEPLKLDLYVPTGPVKPPLIVYVHGGGWGSGSKEDMPLGKLVAQGFAVASVNYRLSTVAPFPAQAHDIKAAIRFLRAKAKDLGISNATQIAIAGGSAGGHLAAIVGVSNGEKALEGTVGAFPAESSDVQAIISLYGASNLQTILSQSTPHGLSVRVPALQRLLGGQPEEKPELARLASPVAHLDANDPPLLLIHGDADPQMPYQQSQEFQRAYEKAKLRVQFETVPGGKHGGREFFDEKRVTLMAGFLTSSAAPSVSTANKAARPQPPRPVPTFADVSYGPHPHQLMDVHLPPTKDGAATVPAPVLIWFGGLWEASKNVPDLNRFRPSGIAVVSVESRTLKDGVKEQSDPPVSYPMNDACRAVQFVRLHAAEWHLDPHRIAVGGGSQGSLPALYVGCAPDRTQAKSADPVERESTQVTCVAAYRSQPSIDPVRMQQWVPGVAWGAPALGCSFTESLDRHEALLPAIRTWSPDALLHAGAAPIYFENNWDLTQPPDVTEADYKVHSPAWALGFQKLAQEAGATCHVKFPGHPTEGYKDIWEFIVKSLTKP